jgi:cold shock CspA family protein
MSAANFEEVTKNAVFRTPQRQSSPCVGNNLPAANTATNVTIACRVRWYNQQQGWGYASPQQIYRPDVRISSAVIREAGLDSVAPGDMFMVTFDRTRTRPNAVMLRSMVASSCQHSLLDLLDALCLSKVLQHMNAHEGGQALTSMARFCIAYRPAFLLEKEFHYGHLLLGCQANCVPPLRWFEQRISRISSVSSAHLAHRLPASLQHHPIRIQLTSTRNEEYRSIKKYVRVSRKLLSVFELICVHTAGPQNS